MFKKPFKIKSNTQIKNSDKKNLKDVLLKKFPTLGEADVEEILPKKETVFCSKVLTATSKTVMIYTIQKRAILFSIDDLFYPTIYLLWRYPNMGITFTTNDFVLSKIYQGADLMLPGIFGNPAEKESFLCKQVGIINNVSNKSAAAVGAIAMSSTQMQGADHGKCVIVYHFYGDKLCSMEDMDVLPMPLNRPLNYDAGEDEGDLENEDEEEDSESDECHAIETPGEEVLKEELEEEAKEIASPESEVGQMDSLLVKCFLTALKYSKTLEMPMLTSTFYKLQMMPVCPEGLTLDIKKSSYKKVGQFLKAMEKEGLIVIKEKKKGVEMIEGINKEHEKFLSFYVDLENRPKKETPPEDSSQTRNIVESYAVSQAVLPLFKEFGIRKSETMTTTEIKNYVTTYVKDHSLQNPENKRLVNVQNDKILSAICKNEMTVTWEDLLDKVTSSMKSCFKINTGMEEILNKGKIQPIIMSTQTRSGNKKVTIVDNLELYHIKLSEFAKECQHGVAASTSISRPPSKKYDQILIQGNQINFVFNLLTDKYKIPKKYIRGLEFAPKTKKK